MKKTLLLTLFLVFFACSCKHVSSQGEVDKISNQPIEIRITNFNNNVYYFSHTGENFAYALSKFLSTHQNLEVTAIAGDGTLVYGVDAGYIVTFKEKCK